MGCDIHLHIELLIRGKWEHYAAPSMDRWYKLFGAMAGVRDKDETPIVAPKGFPSDASIITKIDRLEFGPDGHTDSWFSHDEIMALEDRLHKWSKENVSAKFPNYDLEFGVLKTYCFGNSFTAHWRYGDVRYLPDAVDDVRFVFWFDN